MAIDYLKGMTKKELKSPVGEFMLPVETVFKAETRVRELLDALEVMEIRKELRHVYLVDGEERLLGVVPTRSILFSKKSLKLMEICDTNIVKVSRSDELEIALRRMVAHELLSLPVVDDDDKLVGVIEIVPHHLRESLVSSKEERQAARELFQILGFSPDELELDSVLSEYRYRMPWLLCNLAGGLACAVIGNFYRDTLDELVVLAMFIPLVLTLGESVSVQSMTLSVQYLSSTKLNLSRFFSRLLTEAKVSILLGASCVAMTGLLFAYWESSFAMLLGISGSIMAGLIFAAVFGTAFPVILHKLSFDPKVAGGPVVLSLTDVAVTLIYLSLSTWLVHLLH